MTQLKSNFEELKASGDLPSPMGVALTIFQLTRKPDVSLSEIAHVVKADPSLSGKLIKSANVLKAGTRSIASVSSALNLLGMNETRQLAIGFSILAGNRRGACKHFDYMRFWSKSLAAAIISQMLCERERVAQPEECFVGALLSNVGMLALATLYPVAYSEILSANLPVEKQLLWEKARFETDHVELTAALMEDWMLPQMFADAASHHNDPEGTGFTKGTREYGLCRIWHFADMLADKLVSGEKAIVRSLPEFIKMASEWELDQDDFIALSNDAVALWQEWSRILEVPSRDLPNFAEMIAALPEDAPDEAGKPNPHLEFPLRIMLAGDDMNSLGRLSHEVSSLGHSVEIATNLQDALQLALDADPQLVICDLSASIEFAKALRDLPSGKFVYMILLVSENSEEKIVSAFSAGADAVMARPYGAMELAARVLAGQRFVRMREELLSQSESLRNVAAELAVANRRAQKASMTDQLTGLPNRRYAIERLATEWKRTQILSCLMIDIDKFKSVNDLHGHDIGDEVIRHLVHTLRSAMRTQDAICRFGGEEFLAILPSANANAAINCAERFRIAVESSPYISGKLKLKLTVSIGVASRRPAMRTLENLIKSADTALYEAKKGGRNRAVLAKSKQS